jgi:hypothetical protein
VALPKNETTRPPKPNKHHKSRKRRNGFVFFLGGLFGIMAAGFFANKSDLIEFPEFAELSMDSIMDVLPAGFVRDAKDLAVSFREMGERYGWMGANGWISKEKEMLSITIPFK